MLPFRLPSREPKRIDSNLSFCGYNVQTTLMFSEGSVSVTKQVSKVFTHLVSICVMLEQYLHKQLASGEKLKATPKNWLCGLPDYSRKI